MRSKNPRLRAYLEKKAETDLFLDFMLRGRAVAPDPDGEHLWLLLDPKKGEEPDTIH